MAIDEGTQRLNALGVALAREGRLDEAMTAFRAAVARGAAWAEPAMNLGDVLRQLQRGDEALEAYRDAVAREPSCADAQHLLGSVLGRHGLREEAREHYLEALRLDPTDAVVHSSLLYLDGYDLALSPTAALRAHVTWDRLHGGGRATPLGHENGRDPERRLRVGYVSSDFRAHPVARFMLPIFEAHDRERFEVWSYARVVGLDAVGKRLRAASDGWCSTAGLDDESVAARLRADRIDVLVDLSGHTSGHCLGAFARGPAPVQVSYLGYPRTTGVAAIQYRLTDAACDPPGADDAYTEELVRLPGAWFCWDPPPAPAVAPPPCLRNGYVTFGSMHNVLKINDRVLALWARVLRAVPGARLRVHRNTLIGATRERFLAGLIAGGADPARVEMSPLGADGTSHLAAYADLDVSLDAQPWSAHTTACESLWMGVPLIAWRGSSAAGRQSASLLEAAGLPELVADTPDDVVALAASWAAAPARLARLRGELRERVRRSPLCDGASFTRGLEAAYRGLWRRWCGSGAADSPAGRALGP